MRSRTIPLRRVALVIAGQSPPSGAVTDLFDGLPFLQGNADFGTTFPLPRQQCLSAAKRSMPDDLLISVRAPVGALNWADRSYGIGRGLAAIRVVSGSDRGYLAYAVSAVLPNLRAESTGTTFDAVTTDQLLALSIPWTDHKRQRRIADFLDDQVSRIEGAVGAHAGQLELMARRRESALEFIVLGRDRGEVVNAAWGPFLSRPASWREGQLRSVGCDVQTGPFGSQLHADEYVDNGWPVVNPANIGPGGLTAIPECSVDDTTRGRLGRHVLRLGDVVFGRRGELGRAGLVSREQVGWVCGTGSLRVRLLDEQLSPEYLLRLLRTSALRHYFDTQAVGSTMANLNTGILMAMPLLLPHSDEQARIVAEAREVEAAHDEIERLIRSQALLLTERKRALIMAAVTGEFDVTTASGRGVA